MSRRSLLAALCLIAASLPAFADNHLLKVSAGYSTIEFNTLTGVPESWQLCQLRCEESDPREITLFAPGDGRFAVNWPAAPGGAFQAELTDAEDAIIVRFFAPGKEFTYRLSRTRPVVEVSLPAGASLDVATGSSFIPDRLPGIGAIYSRVHLAQVDRDGQELLTFDEDEPVTAAWSATSDNWGGIRNRYWALLAQPVEGGAAFAGEFAAENRPELGMTSVDASVPLVLQLYAGPVDWRVMREVSPVLPEMLFAALWDFLRWLCFGMLILLEWLHALVGNFGVAIILLSLSAKILMSPLTMLADRWQSDVNRIQTLLKPELDEIKRNYKGEEAHERTLAVYKKHKVSMFYTFKSAAGFLIQIPVFIAAFDMLAENVALNQVGFLWAADLARPDAFAALPFVLPFFGGWLNLLPFIMTFLSSLAAWLQSEESLSADLQRQQSLRLYLMAGAFFVLFYTFPAGMVLYWTSSNFFHLVKVESGRLFKRAT